MHDSDGRRDVQVGAMAGIVYDGVRTTTGDGGKLFGGQNFWFSSAVPQRKWLIENAIANGATVVPLEKQADVLIVDHARKNAPVGTHSYKYIEQSIRNGRLEDLADHVVGPSKSTHRPVGSMTTAPKGSRSKYTEAEDQLLWNFIKPYETAGGATGGNEIYKQLEEAHGNGRHTYQSWRDRWLKHVRYQNRQITDNVYTAENADEGAERTQQMAQASPRRRVSVFAIPATPSPRKAVGVTDLQATLAIQNRSHAAPTSSQEAFTFYARKSLERKLGRILPDGPSSLNPREWEPAAFLQKPQDVARTEAVQAQRQQAGLGIHIPAEKGVLEQRPFQSLQTGIEEADEVDIPVRSSQGSAEEFTEEEYRLLLDAAGHIIRVGDQEDDSWEQLAGHYPSHSSRSWRGFWEEKVKPDYQKQLLQIKKEPASQEEAEEGPALETLQEVAQEPAEQSDETTSSDDDWRPPSQSDEEVDDELEGAVEEDENGEVAEEAQLQDDGLDSLFSSQVSGSSQGFPPFTCRWLGCDMDAPNMYTLIQHVFNLHEPSTKEVADDRGYTCRWSGCRKVRVDEYGDEIVLGFQSRQVWANHFINEHIEPLKLKHGLGPFVTEEERARRELRKGEQRAAREEPDDSDFQGDHVALVSPERRKKLAQPKGSSEEDAAQEENAVEAESEEAEETEPTSSPAEPATETVVLSSSEDDNDQDFNNSPRRSKRLRNAPRPQHTKDLVFSYVDKAVGSSPPPAAQNTPAKSVNSSSFYPLSPSPSKPPEPNEARKRSANKGNSQESTQSTSNAHELLEIHIKQAGPKPVILSPRKRSREPEPEITSQKSPELSVRTSFVPRIKRRKEWQDENEQLEIPSTPDRRTVLGEHRGDNHEGSSMLGGSPTYRPHLRKGSGDDSLPLTPTLRADFQGEGLGHTSPLQISMFSDPDNKFAPSSPARSTSTRQDELSSEADLDFETAPLTTGNLWGTAPSEGRDEEDTEQEAQYETAPESKGKKRGRLDTQSLFAQSVPDIDDDKEDPFALPEPEGGWPDDMDDMDEDNDLGELLTELPIPTSYQPERVDDAHDEDDENDDDDEDDDDDDDDASSIPSDVPGWVAERTAEDESLDVEILLRAIQATSGFNKKLIIEVHDFIRARRLRKDPDMLPMYMEGCWTNADDAALRAGNRKEIIRVTEKHGGSSVGRRREWLGLTG